MGREFKKAMDFNTGGGGGGFTVQSRVVKEDSGYAYFPNKLSRAEEGEREPVTEIRIIPAVEVGKNKKTEVLPPFNPEGTAQDLPSNLGPAFAHVQLVTFFKDSAVHTVLASMPPVDEHGRETPYTAPWIYFMSRMNFKHKEITQQVSRGGAVEPACLPWADEKESTFPRPAKSPGVWMVQALARSIDGRVEKRDGKPVPQGPGVFVIPASAQLAFFGAMFSVDPADDGEEAAGLTLQTCKLGDFYSLENGRMLKLEKFKGSDDRIQYSLSATKRVWPLTADEAARLYGDWGTILDLKTPVEQIREIGRYFEPRMLAYAFKGTFLEGRAVEAGVDMSLARDVLRAEMDLFYGKRVRSAEEVAEALKKQGSELIPEKRDARKAAPGPAKEDRGEDLVDLADGGDAETYAESLKKMNEGAGQALGDEDDVMPF